MKTEPGEIELGIYIIVEDGEGEPWKLNEKVGISVNRVLGSNEPIANLMERVREQLIGFLNGN